MRVKCRGGRGGEEQRSGAQGGRGEQACFSCWGGDIRSWIKGQACDCTSTEVQNTNKDLNQGDGV